MEGDDFDDNEAKTDSDGQHTAQPGLYLVVPPEGGFDEYVPRNEVMDLRRDGTAFVYYIGADEFEGNIQEGYGVAMGTYKLTRDRYDNKYIRFTVDGQSWREKYSANGTELRIYWANDDHYVMKRQKMPLADWVRGVKAAVDAGAAMSRIEDIYADDVPYVLRHRSYDLDDIHSDLKMFRLTVEDEKAYVITFGENLEIYRGTQQLLAVKKAAEWTYALW